MPRSLAIAFRAAPRERCSPTPCALRALQVRGQHAEHINACRCRRQLGGHCLLVHEARLRAARLCLVHRKSRILASLGDSVENFFACGGLGCNVTVHGCKIVGCRPLQRVVWTTFGKSAAAGSPPSPPPLLSPASPTRHAVRRRHRRHSRPRQPPLPWLPPASSGARERRERTARASGARQWCEAAARGRGARLIYSARGAGGRACTCAVFQVKWPYRPSKLNFFLASRPWGSDSCRGLRVCMALDLSKKEGRGRKR